MLIRMLFQRGRESQRLDAELQYHLERQIAENIAGGMSPDEARHAALRVFGNPVVLREQAGEAWSWNWLELLLRDVRYAFRGFRRTPGFAVTVVATIALGLGLNTSVFTIFNAYVLRPLSVRDPYSLYNFTLQNRTDIGDGHEFTWREFEDLRTQNVAFAEVVGLSPSAMVRTEGRTLFGQLVTGNYFRMLGVHAVLGRPLVPEDAESPGREPVVVLSATTWKNKFASDPDIVGKKLIIRGYPLEVVGVAQQGFMGLSGVPLDFWAPLTMAPQLEEGASLFGSQQPRRLRIVGRLRHELSVSQAQAMLTAWVQQRTGDAPDSKNAARAILKLRATTIPFEPEVVAFFSPIIAAFGLVLLIACANVANMMLARGMARQREIGIRLAIGAGRVRLIRQLLTESVLLALPGAAAGFFISKGTIDGGERLMFATLPRGYAEFLTILPLELDVRVFSFMLLAAVLAALFFGLMPALQATRSNVMQVARGEFTTDFRPARFRNALVVGQVAVSVLLLICAAVLLRANGRLHSLDVGLKTRGVIEMEVQDKFRPQVMQAIVTDPVVEGVAGASKVPFMGYLPWMPVTPDITSKRDWAQYIHVTPEYFPMFQVPILRGRNFTREEAKAGAPVVVISDATAHQLWPGREALGRSIRVEKNPEQGLSLAENPKIGRPASTTVRVIGIARDAVNGYIGDATDKTCVYFPGTAEAAGYVLFVRVHGNAEVAGRRLDTELTASIPGAVEQIHSMDEILTAQLWPYRMAYWISSAIGILALLLTLSGLYGVLSYLVTQRTKEIGIRVVLGASTRSVAGLVLSQSLKLTSIGAAVGAMTALGVSNVLASQLEMFMFDKFDGMAYATVAVLVTAASACATYLPCRRAAGIEPTNTLRYD
jgi:predicted permease